MVENYLPGDDKEFDVNNPYPSSLGECKELTTLYIWLLAIVYSDRRLIIVFIWQCDNKKSGQSFPAQSTICVVLKCFLFTNHFVAPSQYCFEIIPSCCLTAVGSENSNDCKIQWFSNCVNVSDLHSLKYFSFMKLLCNISSIFSSLFAGISASLSLSSLGSPTGSEPSSLRARHGSHHQSRRTSFHRKSRKHSGSFDWRDCFKCIFKGLFHSIFWHLNSFKPNLPTFTSNSDNLLPDFCSPKYPRWYQFFWISLMCWMSCCNFVIFLYCC